VTVAASRFARLKGGVLLNNCSHIAHEHHNPPFPEIHGGVEWEATAVPEWAAELRPRIGFGRHFTTGFHPISLLCTGSGNK
jgi:hypothetical protein